MSLLLGYNTNGFAHHRLAEAVEIIAEIGYRAVGLTLDHQALDPFGPTLDWEIDCIRRLLDRRQLACVVETGARFLLDPRRKHQPTLVSESEGDRARREAFLNRAIEIASRLGAGIVSFWAGEIDASVSGRSDRDESTTWACLVAACRRLAELAARSDVRLAFEPEPGMFIEKMSQYERLAAEVNHPSFGLTLDVGHVHCLRDGDPADRIRRFGDGLLNVHIEDMRAGVHEHLMFGEGEMDFRPIMSALGEIHFGGPVVVELSRHSHDAVNAAERAFQFLSGLAC